MDSRERVIRALRFQGPDRVPLMHRTLPGAFRQYGRALEELYERYPSDVLLSPTLRAPFSFWGQQSGAAVRYRDGKPRDEWGCVWDSLTTDWIGQVVESPLADWAALESYRVPDPQTGEEGVREMVETVRQDGHHHYVMVAIESIWHRMTFLRGFESLCMDLAEGREEVVRLRDLVVDYNLRQIERWAKHANLVDGVLIGDDWGTQSALMIRPTTWREVFKPAYRQLVEAIHAAGLYAHIHSDGHIQAIIPDLIEIGLDEVNPQLSCMDAKVLGQEFGGEVCFRADLDRQRTLPFGTPADVEAHVRQAFQAFGRFGGGYIGYGQINIDVPLPNAEAMLRTVLQLTY